MGVTATTPVHPADQVADRLPVGVDGDGRRPLRGDGDGDDRVRFRRSRERRLDGGDHRLPEELRILLGAAVAGELDRRRCDPDPEQTAVVGDHGGLGTAGTEVDRENRGFRNRTRLPLAVR